MMGAVEWSMPAAMPAVCKLRRKRTTFIHGRVAAAALRIS